MAISHRRDEVIKRGRNRKARPKSFSTEDAAHAWAKLHKVAKYTLKRLTLHKKHQKIVVVV